MNYHHQSGFFMGLPNRLRRGLLSSASNEEIMDKNPVNPGIARFFPVDKCRK